MKTETNIPYKYYLEESELPTAWYNVRADMKNKPAPLLNPGTLQPMTAKELDGVFCDELVQQELDDTTARWRPPAWSRPASLRQQSTEPDGHSANSRPAALQDTGRLAASIMQFRRMEEKIAFSGCLLPGDGRNAGVIRRGRLRSLPRGRR